MSELPHILRTPPVSLRPDNPPRRSLIEFPAHLRTAARGELQNVEVRGVTISSSDLHPGELFVGVRGAHRHGAEFAAQAAQHGAAAILTDAEGSALAERAGLPVLVQNDLRPALGSLAAWVYGTAPDDRLPALLGVTGTNGKTSIAHLLEGLLTQLGVPSAASTSAERIVGGRRVVSGLTSPEATEFHAFLALARERGAEAVAVEVSAQALARHRLDGVVFDVVAFTNLTHDHLDDFGDMEAYYQAKAPLFTRRRARRAVVSLDSVAGSRIVADADLPVTTIAAPEIAADPEAASRADWIVRILEERQSGTVFSLEGPGGRSLRTQVPVIGAHMASNAGVALVVLLEAGYSWQELTHALERDGGIRAWVPGRTQLVSGPEGPAVYVDFGHTPDAFEKTLAAVRSVTPGRLLMLFGADGDRDTTKRFDMGRAAVEGSDIVVITDHHPRTEDPQQIRTALLAGARAASSGQPIYEVFPPEAAIAQAVTLVGPGDAILWAGPGHQDYREINGRQWAYSARELARRALIAAGWPAPPRAWANPYQDD